MQHTSLEMRLLAPLLGLSCILCVACSGTDASSIGTDGPGTLPEAVDPPPATEAPGEPLRDAGTTPPAEGGVGELATVALSIGKQARTVTLQDPNGFVPQARLADDGKSIEVRVWITPPNTHVGGYSVEESFFLTIPTKTGTVGCGQGAAAYVHSRLYDQSPPGAPVYNPFESFETKANGNACSITTKSIDPAWVEGSASGTLTRIKNVNGTSAASLAFEITYRVPRR